MAGKFEITESLHEMPVEKELIVKRVSASKFEVYDASDPLNEIKEMKSLKEEEQSPVLMARKSVIQKAPPAPRNDLNKVENLLPNKKRRVNSPVNPSPVGVILIKDAIMYRIIDILMWKVMGEKQLRNFGYPVASTCQVLWRIIYHNNQNLEAREMKPKYLNKDHDCGGNVACFTNHVYQFLEMCAPNLWKRTGWENLTVEELLRRIYYEGLDACNISDPFLENNPRVLVNAFHLRKKYQSHSEEAAQIPVSESPEPSIK